MTFLYVLLNWLLGFAAAYWVFQDALRRRSPHGLLWAAFTFFFWQLGLIGYLYMTRVAPRPPAASAFPPINVRGAAGGPVGRRGTGRPPAAARTPTGRLDAGAAASEPHAVRSIEDTAALIALAVQAVQAGRPAEVSRLMGRVYGEAAPDDLRLITDQLGAAWLASVRPRLPVADGAVVQGLVEEAAEAVGQGRFERAADLLARAAARAVRVEAQHPGALLVLSGLARVVDARRAAAAPPGDEPTTADGWIDRGHALLDGAPEQALACYARAAALAPDDGGGWAGQAMTLRHLGRHAEAIPFYDRLVALRPDGATFWFERADCLEVVGRLEEALASYDRALELDPAMAAAWVDRGHVLNRLARPHEALASNVRGCELAPDHHAGWLNRAEQERALGMRDAAIASYHRFLAIAPPEAARHVPHVRAKLAELEAAPAGAAVPEWKRLAGEAEARAAEGDLDGCRTLYERAAAAEPAAAARLYHNLAVNFLRAERDDDAARAFREALARDPKQVPSLDQLAKLHRRKLRFAEALDAYQRLAELQPQDGDVLGMVADLQHRAGRYEEALATLARFEPAHPHLLRLRGSCLFALGKPAEALEALARVPAENLEAHVDRGLCLERLGRKADAIASYERGHVMSGRRWFHLARLQPEHAVDYFGRAVEALSADARIDGLPKIAATELAYARKRLAELDPERAAELDAFDRQRRGELAAQGRPVG